MPLIGYTPIIANRVFTNQLDNYCCWAASMQMACKLIGRIDINQDLLRKEHYAKVKQIRGAQIYEVISYLRENKINFKGYSSLGFKNICRPLRLRHPVICFINNPRPPRPKKHVVVITAALHASQMEYYGILDPWHEHNYGIKVQKNRIEPFVDAYIEIKP